MRGLDSQFSIGIGSQASRYRMERVKIRWIKGSNCMSGDWKLVSDGLRMHSGSRGDMATYIIPRVALLFFAMTGRLSPMVTIKPLRLVSLIHWYIPGKKLGKIKVTPYQFYFGIRISFQFLRLIRRGFFFFFHSSNNFSNFVTKSERKRERERVNTKIWSERARKKSGNFLLFWGWKFAICIKMNLQNLLAIS